MDDFLLNRLNQINELYFQFPDLPSIIWSKGRIKKSYRKITFGTYHIKKNEIRIHPILKNSIFPSFVLDFVIYHEMLHYEDREILKEIHLHRKKCKKMHTKEFHCREKEFPNKIEASKCLRFIAKGCMEGVN